MKKIDWVLENKQEEIRELITLIQCPSDFGLNDRDEYCRDEYCLECCEECWSKEMEDEE